MASGKHDIFFLGASDDRLQRAAAAARSESPANKDQILELSEKCAKLFNENKINQKNSWELNLIDHLSDIVKLDAPETNFQKAGCALEAGVKIYALRVDSVYVGAHKVLGGITRVSKETEQDGTLEDGVDNTTQEGRRKKEQARKLSPLSTLEPSFDKLNLKKFNVAFSVDPLYHQMSAQFDEGGARGLLLNNLGVYGNCQVLFDSADVPGNCMSSAIQPDGPETVDLTFLRESIQEMVLNMPKKADISPSLKDIVNLFDENNQRPEPYHLGEISPDQVNFWLDNDTVENGSNPGSDQEQTNMVYERSYDDGEPIVLSQHGYEFENANDLRLTSKQMFGAVPESPDHWKYQKAKEVPVEKHAKLLKKKKAKGKKAESDIDFTNTDRYSVFGPPKNPKSILLPSTKARCTTRLPEVRHNQTLLLPHGRKQRKSSKDCKNAYEDNDGLDGSFSNENAYGDNNDMNDLDSQIQQVNQTEVQYNETSTQFDVQALKETLWNHLKQLNEEVEDQDKVQHHVSFKQALAAFPDDYGTASSVSPHLCFICLLHLANEHGLSIQGSANLDDLTIVI